MKQGIINNPESLPGYPSHLSGWPWSEQSDPLISFHPDGKELPRISIVVPSFNQGNYIEETIRSIILQNYPELELIIIDGGSTDNTAEIIKKYEKWITYWVSEMDQGQSHAINKGFNKCTGDLVNWICSDDLLCKNALNRFVSQYYTGNNFLYIGQCLLIDRSGKIIGETRSEIQYFDELLDLRNRWRKNDSIAQQSALFPLDSIRRIGGVNPSNHFTMDYELWGRLLLDGIQVKNIPLLIGAYRWYDGQKTSYVNKVTKSLVDSAHLLVRMNRSKNLPLRIIDHLSISFYFFLFLYHRFRSFIGIRRRLKKILH